MSPVTLISGLSAFWLLPPVFRPMSRWVESAEAPAAAEPGETVTVILTDLPEDH